MITVSEKGQIAIPISIRESLGIERGDELLVTVIEDKIVIEKAANTEKRMKDEFKDILKHNENFLKKIWNNNSDKIWEKYLK
jgi:AbrB family looped-hinge helix DNA binding protein